MARDPSQPPDNMPEKVLIHEVARHYNKLPWEIKCLPFSEWKEMLEMMNIRNSAMGS